MSSGRIKRDRSGERLKDRDGLVLKDKVSFGNNLPGIDMARKKATLGEICG